MERKYSLAHLSTLGCPPPEMIYIAKMTGYDYVGIRPIYMGLPGEPNYNLINNKNLLNLTKTALKETGIKINDIELAKIDDNIDVSMYEPTIEICAELGAKDIISSIWTSNNELALEKFSKLCDLAAQYDMHVNLEFVTWSECKTLKEAKKLITDSNKKNVAYLIDTLHFYRSKVDLSELDTIPKEMFRFAHICDGPFEIPYEKEKLIHTGRDERLYVGEGSIDILSIIEKLGPETVLSIELPHIKRVNDYGYTEHANRCIKSAKNYFAKPAYI